MTPVALKGGELEMPDDELQSLQTSYRMPPTAFLPELPSTGISLSRWRTEGGPSHLIEHRLSAYTLSLILQPMRARAWLGSTAIWSGPIGAHTIRLTPPELSPRWQGDGAFDFLLFTIPSRTVEMMAGKDAPRIHDILRQTYPLYVRDDVVLQIGRNMLSACGSDNRYARQFADALGLALVAHLLNHYADAPRHVNRLSLSPSRLRRVTQYVTDHLGEAIRVGDLARITGLSESHFAHAFRASMGVSPHRFVIAARIEKAQRMLQSGGKSIAEIALECGFKDAGHFTRAFRANTGVTPRAFRFGAD